MRQGICSIFIAGCILPSKQLPVIYYVSDVRLGAPPRLDVDREMFILTGPLTSWKNFVVYLTNITSVLSKSEYADIFSTIPEFDFPKI